VIEVLIIFAGFAWAVYALYSPRFNHLDTEHKDRQQSGTQTAQSATESPIIMKSTQDEHHGRNEKSSN